MYTDWIPLACLLPRILRLPVVICGWCVSVGFHSSLTLDPFLQMNFNRFVVDLVCNELS